MKQKGKKALGIGKRIIIYVIAVILFLEVVTIVGIYSNTWKKFNEMFDNEAELVLDVVNDQMHFMDVDISYYPKLIRNIAIDENKIPEITAGNYNIFKELAETCEISNEIYFYAFYDTAGNLKWNLHDVPKTLDISTLSDTPAVFTDPELKLGKATKVNVAGGWFVVGYNIADDAKCDEIAEATNSVISIYAGNTSVATSIKDTSGNRTIGTAMDADVKSTVISSGQEFRGRLSISGDHHSVVYVPLKNTKGVVVGSLFVGYNVEDVYQSIFQAMAGTVVIATVVIAASSVALYFVIKKIVTDRLIKLEGVANNIEIGNLSDEPVDAGKLDEVGAVITAINNTTVALNEYITDIHDVLAHIENGDFTYSSTVDYKGDFIKIKESLNNIVRVFSDVIRNVKDSAESVDSNASQISTASQMLAEGTSTQAATIEEISSTVVDLSDRVNDNAQNTAKAKKLSDKTNDRVHDQNSKMSNMLVAMNDIKEKSNEIQKIIKSIDDIAFQTNILSLNAAVEAARAGAAGKGFAVVAEEVRNLAIKSAEAAAETTQYIEASINAVNDGVVLAQEAATSLSEVMTISSETNDIIVDISQKTEEQATALKEVSIGLDQISDVVQQNSATAQENAASCAELDDQVRHLQNILSRFTLQ